MGFCFRILILALLACSGPALAESKPGTKAKTKECLRDGSLCVGDVAYGFKKDSPLVVGKVKKLPSAEASAAADARVTLEAEEFPVGDVARTTRSQCATDIRGEDLCPGDAVKKDGKSAVVLGVFPKGFAVVAYQDAKQPVSERADLFEVFKPACDAAPALGEAIKGLTSAPKLAFETSPKTCAGEQVAADPKKNCNEPAEPITADDSPRKAYFEELLKKGAQAPLGDFLKLWYPGRKRHLGSDDESYIFKCQKAPWQNFKGGPDGYLTKECSPDTLYSWGPPAKITTLKQTMADGKAWQGPLNPKSQSGLLFTSASAVSTYPFGVAGVRIKLKPGVRTKLTGWAHHENGVVALNNDWAQDYVLSDASLVESWSYGTPEHYDEIVRDILRFASGKTAMHWSAKQQPTGTGVARLFSYGLVDNQPNDEATLKATLLGMIKIILSGQGQIQYADGACRNRAQHFATDHPSYMNP